MTKRRSSWHGQCIRKTLSLSSRGAHGRGASTHRYKNHYLKRRRDLHQNSDSWYLEITGTTILICILDTNDYLTSYSLDGQFIQH